MFEVKNISFAYKKSRPVLKDVSFSLEAGQTMCMLGPNGTGKTTLLKCLLGLSKAGGGTIEVDGDELTKLGIKQRAKYMAYVPQSTGLAFSYEVQDVVMMGRIAHLKFGAAHTSDDKKIVAQTMEDLRISHLMGRKYQELSGGEKQMIMVARAVVQQAKYLIMDEPTANLDYSNQIKILRVIRKLSNDGYGILMTSHYPDHAFLACSRALLMKDGYVQEDGLPEDVVTTGSLTKLYDTEVYVTDAQAEGEQFRVCIPKMTD